MAAPDRIDAYHFYEDDWERYETLYESFEWETPESCNIAHYVCDRWAGVEREDALYASDDAGRERTFQFGRQVRANALANHRR